MFFSPIFFAYPPLVPDDFHAALDTGTTAIQHAAKKQTAQLRDMGSVSTWFRFLKLYGTLCSLFFSFSSFSYLLLSPPFPPPLLLPILVPSAPFILYLECKIYYYELFSYSIYLIFQRKI